MNATRILSLGATSVDSVRARIRLHSVETDNGCIVWTGSLDRYGYGRFRLTMQGQKRQTGAHRIAWLAFEGDIPAGDYVVDHLCRNRACVNTAHMRIVTNAINTQCGAAPVANRETLGLPVRRRNQKSRVREVSGREMCIHGHPWVEENIYRRVDKAGYAHADCIMCIRDRMERYRSRHAA